MDVEKDKTPKESERIDKQEKEIVKADSQEKY